MEREILLVNETDFAQTWAKESLGQVIRENMKVVLLPLSYNDGWASDAQDWNDKFARSRTHFNELCRPFLSYGIRKKNIKWLNYYDFDFETVISYIHRSNILVLVAEDAHHAMQQIQDYRLEDTICKFNGLIIGISAGAKILQSSFFMPLTQMNDVFLYTKGLGLIKGFDLDMNYVENPYHIRNIIYALEQKSNTIIILPKHSGIYISDGHIDLLGEAFIADERDLDELYNLIDTFE